MFSRLLSSNKRAIGLAIRPSFKAVGSAASPAWRKQAHAICAAVPHSKSFSSLLGNSGSWKKEDEQDSKVVAAPRQFSTLTKDEEKPTTFGGVVKQYGVLPLAGLVGVAALSKEIYFLGAETLLLGNFVLTFFVGYIVAGESMHKYFQGQKTAFQGKIDDVIDLQTAFWDSLTNEYKARLGFAAYLKDIKAKEIESMRLLNEAQGFQARHEAHANTLRKLRGIAHEEFEARAAESARMSVEAAAYVRANFAKADAKTKARCVENAIADLGKAEVAREIAADPVKSLFMDYFAKQAKQ